MIRGALGSRYGIGPLGRGVIRPQAGGWWLSGGISADNCIAAYQPKGAGSLAASYSNLANPGTNNAAPGNAPTWDATNGWIFDSTDYLTTGYNINTKSHSIIIRYTDAASGSYGLFGNYKTANDASIYVRPNYLTTTRVYYGSTDYSSGAAFTNGVLCIAGNGTSFSVFRNGTVDGSPITQTATAMNDLSIFIGCLNINGSPSQYQAVKIQAMAIYNINIASYVSALTTAMNAL